MMEVKMYIESRVDFDVDDPCSKCCFSGGSSYSECRRPHDGNFRCTDHEYYVVASSSKCKQYYDERYKPLIIAVLQTVSVLIATSILSITACLIASIWK